MTTERRDYKTAVELRDGPNGPMIAGYMAVYNKRSADMGFVETIDPGAFKKTLQEADIRGIGNHNTDWLLGRTKPGTMRVRDDGNGVYYEIDVNLNDPDGQRAYQKVQRGDWDGSSFTFQTIRDEWNWDTQPPERRLLEVALVEGGPCTFPAYPDATAVSRALEPIAETVGRPVEDLVSALKTGEIRSLINGGNNTMTTTEPAVDERTDDTQTEERAGKVLSAATMERLSAIRDSINDLMDVAKGGGPVDSDMGAWRADTEPDEDEAGGTGDGDGDENYRGLTKYAADLELRARLAVLDEAA